MRMAVVNIREVRVLVDQSGMAMPVLMRLDPGPVAVMVMLVVRIVDMGVAVLDRFVRVQVIMPLGEMQPHAPAH